ncbi:TPA: hypothetical protein DCG86_03665, partial [Candidatus Marinimicrobia bacterium]|nr:hypothetical protein [Candidatus Neomarinimicrobiota bacterium]
LSEECHQHPEPEVLNRIRGFAWDVSCDKPRFFNKTVPSQGIIAAHVSAMFPFLFMHVIFAVLVTGC